MTLLVLGEVAGGIVLFLLGMPWLSAALREAAGERLRAWLASATGSPLRGLALGTTVGCLAHSSAASVMTIGFINAGLLSLVSSLPLIIGANFGTTLSMQLISFRLTDYALAAIAIGGVVSLLCRDGRVHALARAVLGFGLLFLGMKICGDAIVPYRETLAPYLAQVDGTTWPGLLLGVGVAMVITGLIQSSGAVIGMTFVLAGSGVFTSLAQTYPIVLGAHIGTTVTGLLAAVGATPDARRAALGNALFNVFNAGLGLAGAGILIPLLERTSDDVVHQTANTHTAIMALAVLVVLPLIKPSAALLRRVMPSPEPEPPGSFLDAELLTTPEDAIRATLQELGRCAGLCVESFRIVDETVRSGDRRMLRRVERNERSVNEIKTSVQAYLGKLTHGYLSRRQALLVQALNRCIVGLERIGDHIDSLGQFVRRGRADGLKELEAPMAAQVWKLAALARGVVDQLARSFVIEGSDFSAAAWPVLEARSRYNRESAPVKADMIEQLSRHEVAADLALEFSEFTTTLDRIVRHCAVVSMEQRQPAFTLKESKLGRAAGPHADSVATRG